MENILGRRIKELREKSGYTQKEFAKKMNIGHSTLSQYETGSRIPNDDIKIQFANFFNVSIDYLLGHSAQKEKPITINDELNKKFEDEKTKQLVNIIEQIPEDMMDEALDWLSAFLKVRVKKD